LTNEKCGFRWDGGHLRILKRASGVIGEIGAERSNGGANPSPRRYQPGQNETVNVLVQLFCADAKECWPNDTLCAEAAWPVLERDLLVEDTLTLPVQINGKKRAEVMVARGLTVPRSRLPFWHWMRYKYLATSRPTR